MKKKILVFLSLMALFVCLLAISVSAASIPDWTDITEVDGMSNKSKFGDDGKVGATSRVLMSDGETYPAYYIFKNHGAIYNDTIDLSELNGKGYNYEKDDIVRLEVPVGITATDSGAIQPSDGFTGLMTIAFPNGFKKLAGSTFDASSTESSPIVKVDLPSTLTSIGQYAFNYCTSLEELIIPEGITDIPPNMASYTSSLKKVVLPSTIKTIGKTSFRTSNLSDGIVIPEGCTTISDYAFKGSQVTSVVLPSTLTTVGADAFRECASLTKVVMFGSIMGNYMFYDCSALDILVLTENFEVLGTSALGSAPANGTFITYYTGNDYDRFKTLGSSTSRFKEAKCYSYSDYAENNYTDQYMLIYDCNICVVGFDGIHTEAEDDGDCTTAVSCLTCKGICKEAMEHANGERLAYTDLMSEGEYYFGCTNDGCMVGTTEKSPALFTCLGYSAQLDGNGIVRKFMLNQDAINKYKKLIDPDFEYGIVVSLENTTPLKIENEKVTIANSGILSANFTNGQYSMIQIKINNISSSALSTVIVNTIYALKNGEIYYANIDSMAKIAQGKSYNDLKTLD